MSVFHSTQTQFDQALSPVRTISRTAARLSVAAAAAVLVLLALLHRLSPEFDPLSRMVSEYANGQYRWVLSWLFIAWAVSSWALAWAIRSQLRTRTGKIGWWFLIIAGVGEAMAAFFDINHPLHGVAALLGMPSLPIAALLISAQLGRIPTWTGARNALHWTANLTWLILVLLLVAVAVMMVGFAQTGGQMTPAVIALVGAPNRLLILIYCVWTMMVAWQAIKVQERPPSR